MSSAKAILFGAALIAASILFVNTIQPASAQYSSGLFQLVHNGNTTANSSAFRINSSTGEVSYCYVPGSTNTTDLVCTRYVK